MFYNIVKISNEADMAKESRELEIINNTPEPRTRTSLAHDLRIFGLEPGMTVIVHSALSSLGWVNGGAVALIQALMDVLTPEGTLVMPAHSGDLSEPSCWCNPPVPKDWLQTVRDTMPAYEPDITPTRGIGTVPETFRKFPGVLRSNHPAVSFAAWGKNAGFITAGHGLDFPMGDTSPLARIYDLDGVVLLIGIGYDRNTSLHLAEYRSGTMARQAQGAPILEYNKRVWREYNDIEGDSDGFPVIGQAFEQCHAVIYGVVGSAECRLIRQRELIDFAVQWLIDRSKK
jgi:aminoglycoside 3-N-acetyltransferase